MMHVDATRTLLLTQGYEPVKIIPWQRAMTLLALDKVDVVEEYDAAIRATSLVVKVPAHQNTPRRGTLEHTTTGNSRTHHDGEL